MLTLREKVSGIVIGTTSIPLADDKQLSHKIDKELSLPDGINELEILVENLDGLQSISKRQIHVGSPALADAAKLGRKDYALIFATDKYDNWRALVNPIFDSRTIADDLTKTSGFNT